MSRGVDQKDDQERKRFVEGCAWTSAMLRENTNGAVPVTRQDAIAKRTYAVGRKNIARGCSPRPRRGQTKAETVR